MVTITGLSRRQYLMSGYNGAVGKIISQYNKKIKFFDIDKVAEGIDVFLHLASSTNEKNIITSNVVYLESVVDYCIKNNIKNFVYFSSVNVYGKQNCLDISEDACYREVSLYGVSKLFGETYLKTITNLNILVLRLPAILTHKKDTYISDLLQKIRSNEDINLANYYEQFNNFIDVEDIMRFIDAYKFEKTYEVINFASEQKQTLKDVVLYLKTLESSKSVITYDNTRKDYYNISVDKLIKQYKFKPKGYKESLSKWLEFY